MRRSIALLIVLALLVACAPSAETIQRAISETQTAQPTITPTVTPTLNPTATTYIPSTTYIFVFLNEYFKNVEESQGVDLTSRSVEYKPSSSGTENKILVFTINCVKRTKECTGNQAIAATLTGMSQFAAFFATPEYLPVTPEFFDILAYKNTSTYQYGASGKWSDLKSFGLGILTIDDLIAKLNKH